MKTSIQTTMETMSAQPLYRKYAREPCTPGAAVVLIAAEQNHQTRQRVIEIASQILKTPLWIFRRGVEVRKDPDGELCLCCLREDGTELARTPVTRLPWSATAKFIEICMRCTVSVQTLTGQYNLDS